MATQRSAGAQQLIDSLTRFVDECEEANALLDFAERAPQEIEWHPERGQSLRDALRDAIRREEDRR